MTVLRSIPLSFAILWRYVLVLPFVILGMIVFGLIAGVFALFTAFISPILTFLVIFAFGIAAGVIPVMVGTRLGMQAQNTLPKIGYIGMLVPAIGYGFFEGFIVMLGFGLLTGLYLLLSPVSPTDLMGLTDMDQSEAFATLLNTSPALTLSIIGVGVLMAVAIRAALLVPLTGASIGFDPEGRSHTPFYGFGSGIAPLMFLVFMAYVVAIFIVPIMTGIFASFGLFEVIESIDTKLAEDGANLWEILAAYQFEVALFVGGTILMYLWVLSFQCAGAAVIFTKLLKGETLRREEFERQVEEVLEQDQPVQRRQSDVDMLDLIRSRMPESKY